MSSAALTGKAPEGGRPSKPRFTRTHKIIAIAFAALLLGAAVVLRSRLWPFEQGPVLHDLAEASDSRISMRSFHRTYFPAPGCVIEGLLFIDTYMPFGGRSSGCIWERYAQAMQWILQHKYDIPPASRWVDDFLFVLSPTNSQSMLLKANHAFNDLGVPMDAAKQEGPVTSLVYIGYTLNSDAMTIGTSLKQREKVMPLLDEARGRTITLADLEKLIGKLEFMSVPIRTGRSHMYYMRRALYMAQHTKNSIASSMPYTMYHVHLNADGKAEVRWWQSAIADDVTCSIDLHIPWPSTVAPIEPR